MQKGTNGAGFTGAEGTLECEAVLQGLMGMPPHLPCAWEIRCRKRAAQHVTRL